MYIWDFEVITKWTFHDKDDDGGAESYTVANETFEQAWLKVQKLATAKSSWVDEEDNNRKHKPLSTQLTSVKRGNWIDE